MKNNNQNKDNFELCVFYHVYNNLEAVNKHLNIWTKFSPEVLKRIQFVLVDDCSDKKIPMDLINNTNMNITLARIKDDIKWNQSGANNLGFKISESDWVFSSDIDHFINQKFIEQILDYKKHKNIIYNFDRYYGLDKNNKLSVAPNILLINKQTFWDIGGYDEDFRGNYGHEDKLLLKLIQEKYTLKKLKIEPIQVLPFSTLKLDRDAKINKQKLNQKLKQGKSYKNKETLRFDWEIITNRRIK